MTNTNEKEMEIVEGTEVMDATAATEATATVVEATAEVAKPAKAAKAVVAKVQKPAKRIREMFAAMMAKGIDAEVVMNLCDKDFSAQQFYLRYAFLKKIDSATALKEQTHINGKARYSVQLLAINGEQYVMTNDIYSKNFAPFKEWMEK